MCFYHYIALYAPFSPFYVKQWNVAAVVIKHDIRYIPAPSWGTFVR